MDCPECNERMYYTGEHHPTLVPQRYYACKNRHVFLLRGQREEYVDWSDGSITHEWRKSVIEREGINDWKMVGSGNYV